MKLFKLTHGLRIGTVIAALLLGITAFGQTPPDQNNPPAPTTTPANLDPNTPQPIDSQTKSEVLDRVNDLLTHHAYVPGVDFEKWPDFLAGEKDKLDSATNSGEFAYALNMALTKFGTSHVFLATPRMAALRRDQSIVGIGIAQRPVPEGIEIVRVVPDGPAMKAGLIPGDIITKVDGNKVEGTKGIPGPEGSKVTLTIKHRNGNTEDYTLTRHKFSTVRPEELAEVNKDTAKLTVYTFDWTYSRSNVEDLMRKADKYPNLILDLRGNGGGAVTNLQHLLSFFVPSDEAIGTFVNKQMVNSYTLETHGSPSDVIKIANWSRNQDEWSDQQIKPSHRPDSIPVYSGHVAVLVDGGTGSASEIAAAALHDLIGASIVGQKSAGAVLVSVIVPASNHFTLQYPIMDYVTIRGVRLEGTGVTPQVEVEAAKEPILPGDPDKVVEKAEALFARDKQRDDHAVGV
jgi:carboxyl-terminal processing protease